MADDAVIYEAMCEGLSARGEAYLYVGKTFPPGEWLEVSAAQAKTLELFKGIVTVRERGGVQAASEELEDFLRGKGGE